MGLYFCIVFILASFMPQVHGAYCDCSKTTGRPAYYPEGIPAFDEDEMISEEDEMLMRQEFRAPGDAVKSLPEMDNMTDVLEITVLRADGYADRDGIWNNSDPFVSLWYAGPDNVWSYHGASDVIEGCDGEACDAVFGHVARIPIPRDGLYSVSVEIFDDDPGGSAELLGKKGFRRLPFAGLDTEWRLLDDNQNWNCWSKFEIKYEDNGVDDPAWVSFPQSGTTSEAHFQWYQPPDRSGINHTDLHFSLDNIFGNEDDYVFTVYGQTDYFDLNSTHSLPDGTYHCAIRSADNSGWTSHFVNTGQLMVWLEPTPVPPTPTMTPTPNPATPTPMPGAFVVGDVRIYADDFANLGGGVYRATGNIQINDYVSVEGDIAYLIIHTEGNPWVEGQGLVKLKDLNLPIFIGDFEFDPVAGNPDYGILIPGEYTSQLIELAGFFLHGQPIDLVVNVVEGWIYVETLIEIDVDAIGLHIARVDCVLDWMGNVNGNVYGFSFTLAGVIISFDHAYFNNQGVHIDHFNITLPPDLGGGYADAWGIHITTDDIWFEAAHIVLPVIRLEGGFEITGFDPNTGPEAWIEHLAPPFTGYKWCVDGRMRIPNLGDAGGTLGIETTFSIYGDRLQQACLMFEAGNGLQIPIGSTGLFLYKLGGCVTFNNLPYPDPYNQCAVGTIYDCNAEAFTCCYFNYPDSIKIKLIAGLQGGPDIMGLKCVHADPLWLDIDTGWGVGGGGSIRVIENFEIGAGRVCVSPAGTRVDGWINLAIIQGSLFLLVTPDHAEGAIEGSVTIPPGDYWLFTLNEPINLGHFMLMLGYYWVPQTDFWGSGIWSTCNSSHCEGMKYGVRYSHEIFGQLLCLAMDQNYNFYAWIDLDLWGSMKVAKGDGIVDVQGDLILTDQAQTIGDSATVPIAVPPGMDRSLFTLGYEGDGYPSLKLQTPDGVIIGPENADDKTIFYNERDGARFYSIRNPESGNWVFIVDGVGECDSWEVQLLQGNQAPQVSIESVEIVGQRARIQWTGDDKDGIAQVGLFYDTDNAHADGAPIAMSMTAGQGEQLTHWDLSGIPTGDYYLYAKIDDGINPPVINYYDQPVHIEDTIAPQPPSDLEGTAGDTAVHLWWDAPADRDVHSYQVRFKPIDQQDDILVDTASTDLTISNLINGTPYRFIVVATDLAGNWSRQSRELILTPDPAGDLTPPERVQAVQAVNNQNESITVTWSPSVSQDVAYYLVHYGTVPGLFSGTEAAQGRSPIRVETPSTALTLTGLNVGSRYYFSVQAVDAAHNVTMLSAETNAALISDTDSDTDGMPDDWEVLYWSSLDPNPTGDDDGDGIVNAQEMLLMTHPRLADSDFDRIPDGQDDDPVMNVDLDVDGIGDNWELYYGLDDATADNDGDNLSNLQEYRYGTDPFNTDSDGDGIDDGTEASNTTDPMNPDDPNPRCSDVGVRLHMPSHHFKPGDLCYLDAVICNSFQVPVPEARFFAVLNAYGEYFFAPGWTKELDYWTFGIQPGPQTMHVIPEFSWPTGTGNGSGLQFIGAITDPEISRIIGNYSIWDLGWSE